MTYRRLFQLLFVGSTLVLAGVWWQSMHSGYLYAFGRSSSFGCVIGVSSATVNIECGPSPTWFPTGAGRFPAQGSPTELSGLLGKFNFATGEIYQVSFPVWVPWLLFLAGGYAFVGVMERRLATGKEKTLAAAHAEGDVPKLPG